MFGLDLRAEDLFAICEFACAHAFEEIEILFDGTVAPRAFLAGLGQRAAGLADLVGRLVIDVGEALLDHEDGVFVHLFKIVGAVVETVAPVEAEPVDILHDRFHVFGIFLGGVGVVHAQVAQTAELLRHAEIDAQRLAVPDMQVSVRFRRKTGMNCHAFILAALRNVFRDKRVDEIAAAEISRFRTGLFCLRGSHIPQHFFFCHSEAPLFQIGLL